MSRPPATTSIFKVPPDGQVFVGEIFSRCEDLIDYGVWSGLTRTRLHQWIRNFRTEEEKYFAACLLDSLIYRSDSQTLALIQQLLQRVLPDLARERGWTALSAPDWAAPLQSENIDPMVRLIAVARSTDPPGKSSNVIVRCLKRRFKVKEKWLLTAWSPAVNQLPANAVLIFLDDFLGTGTQFEEFYKMEDLSSRLNAHDQAYTPLVAWQEGVSEVERVIPKVSVRSVELLDASHRIFHDECRCFEDGLNNAAGAKEFYNTLLKARGIQLMGNERRGFGGLELAYSFEHASPDNCLPVFWWKDSAAWTPLFDR